ncbi:MAG: 30S ribosomal protein S7 [Candidatus Woesearchaeota archaeon]
MSLKAFNRWNVEAVQIADPGIKPYINLEPRVVPKTGARYSGQKFHKSNAFIVERFINKIMVAGHKGKSHTFSSGHNTGKASKAYDTMERVLEIVEKRTGQNPITVLVLAIERAAPREEVISIEYGGARYPKAVECAPQRRIDIALRYMTQAGMQKSFRTKITLENALADEIIAAYEGSQNSLAISRKLEVERQADSSR